MPRKLASTEVQKAVYDMINNNLSYAIYDYVPEETAYPYICMEDDSGNPKDDTKDNFSRSIRTTLNIWSNYKGQKECKDIADAIVALFDTSLVVTGFQVIYVSHDFRTIRVGDLRHGILDLMTDLNQI